MNAELTTYQQNLPTTIDDLAKFVLVGREKLVSVRAAIRAIDKVKLAQEVRQQKLLEAQDIADAVLDAEVRIGELTSLIPKATAYNNPGGKGKADTQSNSGVTLGSSSEPAAEPEPQADESTPEPKPEFIAESEPPKVEPPKPRPNKEDIIKEAGFTKMQVQRFEQLAKHPEMVQAAKVEARQNGDIVTRAAVLDKIKTAKREQKAAVQETRREENAEKVSKLSSPLEAQGLFQTIVIDPPWDWGDEGDVNQFGRAKPEYHTMPIDEIAAMPIPKIADDNCHLYLWVTNRSLPKAFRLIEEWGFRYITCLTWVKPSIGMGNYFRGSTEQVLFAVKGSQPLKRRDVGTHFEAPRGDKHSAKPDEFYKLVESCSYAPYIDIFGRKGRDGWSVWGEGS